VEEYVAAKKSGALANDTRVAAILDETFHNETKEEFVETVKGNFSIMMLTGAVITVVLLSGVAAAHFLVKTSNPIPGKTEGGDSAGGDGGDKPKQESVAKPGKGASKEEKQAFKEAKKAEKKAAREKKRSDKELLKEEAKKKKMEKVKAKIQENDGVVVAEGSADAPQTVENPVSENEGRETGADKVTRPFEMEDKKSKKDKKKNEKTRKVSASKKDQEEQAKLESLWAQLDQDGSGALDKNEVAEVMKSMGKPVDAAGLEAAMQEIDKDGSGEVEFEEFLGWWQKQDPEAQKQLMMLQDLNFDDL
jgi:uncharacterized membrane protein